VLGKIQHVFGSKALEHKFFVAFSSNCPRVQTQCLYNHTTRSLRKEHWVLTRSLRHGFSSPLSRTQQKKPQEWKLLQGEAASTVHVSWTALPRHDEVEKLCMFPKMGSCHGPGGRLKVRWVLNLFPNFFSTININSKKERRIGNDKTWSSIKMKSL